jgi:hypothetical protein
MYRKRLLTTIAAFAASLCLIFACSDDSTSPDVVADDTTGTGGGGNDTPSVGCDCEASYLTNVVNNPAYAANEEIFVTHDGDATSISFADFLDVVGTVDNRTYTIAASSDPYVVGCRSVLFGPYGGAEKRQNIIVRGETGNREDVVIVGADPAVDPDFWKSSQYGGPSSCGIGQFIQFYNVENIAIAHLTLRNFPGHMLKLDGGNNSGTLWYPRNIIFHNLEMLDCGDQMIKGGAPSNAPLSCADGILECSYLHYTDGLFVESSYETQGIDLHKGRKWIVRDNVFEKIRIQNGMSHAGNGAAVLMWDGSDSMHVERNLIINCDNAIKLGATWYDDGCDYMVAINNVVVYDDPDGRYRAENIFEIGRDVENGGYFHNTLWNPAQSSSGTVVYCPNDLFPFENNLYLNGSLHRAAGARNNVQADDASWFIDVVGYDFRLQSNHTVPAVDEVNYDADCEERNDTPSAGAYEYQDEGNSGN